MARPRKVNVDVMNTADPVEVKQEMPVHVADPEIVEAQPVEYVVPELEVEIVKPKVQEEKPKMPTPICDIEELSDSDKEVLIEKRIRAIIEQTQIPFIPALIKFKEPDTTSVPPMYALVDFDHRFVNEGWEFYKTNVKNPYVKDYLQLLTNIMNKPNKIYTRLVLFNYE